MRDANYVLDCLWREIGTAVGFLVARTVWPAMFGNQRTESEGKCMKRTSLLFIMAVAVPMAGCAQTPKTNPAGSTKNAQPVTRDAQPLTKIDITKWKVNLISGDHAQSLPAYFPLDDDAAAAVIEIASGAQAR